MRSVTLDLVQLDENTIKDTAKEFIKDADVKNVAWEDTGGRQAGGNPAIRFVGSDKVIAKLIHAYVDGSTQDEEGDQEEFDMFWDASVLV